MAAIRCQLIQGLERPAQALGVKGWVGEVVRLGVLPYSHVGLCRALEVLNGLY